MDPHKRVALTIAPMLAGALAVGGCVAGGNRAPHVPPRTASGALATIGVENASLGNILVDSRGRTLYLFQKDSPGRSACAGSCATNWPPLWVAGKLRAGTGTKAGAITTLVRQDGNRQFAYNGHPLYLFSGDRTAGDTNGQGASAFGGRWYVISPAGTAVTKAIPQPSTGY